MKYRLNTKKLSKVLRSKRGNRKLADVAREIDGVSAFTYGRMERGGLPEIDNYIRICRWLDVSTDFFTASFEKVSASQKNIIARLRTDKHLPKETSNALIQMVKLAYSTAGKKKKKK